MAVQRAPVLSAVSDRPRHRNDDVGVLESVVDVGNTNGQGPGSRRAAVTRARLVLCECGAACEETDRTCHACGQELDVEVGRLHHGDQADRADIDEELAELELFSD